MVKLYWERKRLKLIQSKKDATEEMLLSLLERIKKFNTELPKVYQMIVKITKVNEALNEELKEQKKELDAVRFLLNEHLLIKETEQNEDNTV